MPIGLQSIGMTTSGRPTQAQQLEELIPVDTHKTKYDFIAHNDIEPGSTIL